MLERLMDVLAALLAPVRLEAFRRWRDTFTSLAFPTNTSTSTSSTSVPVPERAAAAAAVVVTEPLSSKRSLIALAPLLGPFCEFIALTVEEVRLVMKGLVKGLFVKYLHLIFPSNNHLDGMDQPTDLLTMHNHVCLIIILHNFVIFHVM